RHLPARRSLSRRWSVNVPLGGLLALVAALPSVRLVSYRQRQLIEGRKACGLCVSCGYDLRATPERCPECGALTQLARLDAAGKPAGYINVGSGCGVTIG